MYDATINLYQSNFSLLVSIYVDSLVDSKNSTKVGDSGKFM